MIAMYVCLALVVFLGLAFAGSSNDSSSILQDVIMKTDKQLVSNIAALNAQDEIKIEPVPLPANTDLRQLKLADITKERTQGDEVVPVYPKLYTLPFFERAENRRVIRVYDLSYFKSEGMKIEVYYTGGDWMQYGFAYLVTAGENWASAYFISTLSTPDREEGSIPPAISPFDAVKLEQFIVNEFLDSNGNVKEKFNKVASLSSDP